MIEGLVGLTVMMALAFLRVPISFAMAIVGIAGYAYMRDWNWTVAFAMTQTKLYETGRNYTLSVVPLFILMRFLGLVNTHGSLVLTYLTFGLPLAIWLLKGFYDNIPVQLEQAARIDGATRFQAFVLIVMPLSVPGIIATAIYSFIGAWNEYIYAYTFLSRNEQLTLPVGVQRFFSENTTDFPGLMAASFMMSVPVVVLFLILQKYFVRALTEGAVKH